MPDNTNSTFQPGTMLSRVKPGELLGFVRRLQEQNLWPLPIGRHSQHPGPTVTPFLVIPAFPGDSGQPRPLGNPLQSLHSMAVEIIDSAGHPTACPLIGQTYTLRCHVDNHGGVAAYGGLAEFYVAQPSVFDQAAVTPGMRPPAKGYVGFVVMPGTSVTLVCPNSWTPVTALDVTSSALVHAYDPFIDPLIKPFDARSDRHAGRLDLTDFRGTWEGLESRILPPPPPDGPTPAELLIQVRLVITQTGLDVNVSIFEYIPLEGPPANPQHIVAGHLTNGQVQLGYTDATSPLMVPHRFDNWILTLHTPHSLHFEHRTHFTEPEHPDTLSQGDLHRV